MHDLLVNFLSMMHIASGLDKSTYIQSSRTMIRMNADFRYESL